MEQAQVLTFLNNKDRDLLLQFCGYSTTEPLHSFGPVVRPHYIIHFILNGKGIFQIREKTYHLETGQGFLIEPDELTFYQSDAQEPWEYLWIGFNGKMIPEFLKQIGLSSAHPIFHCDKKKELYWLVNDMLVHSKSNFSSDLRRTGLLYEFLSILALNPLESDQQVDSEYMYINQAIEYIKNNCWDGIHIYDIAKYLCIDRSYLYLLFHKYLKQSPQDYLATFRLTKASELLSTTTLSIESISNSCGYGDPATFSKAFKRWKSMSPSKYRKQKRASGTVLSN